MEALDVIHVLDKLADVGFGLSKGAVFFEIDLLSLQGLEEAFRFGVVVRVAFGRHARQRTYAYALQPLDVGTTSVLHASVRVMDETWLKVASSQSGEQSKPY